MPAPGDTPADHQVTCCSHAVHMQLKHEARQQLRCCAHAAQMQLTHAAHNPLTHGSGALTRLICSHFCVDVVLCNQGPKHSRGESMRTLAEVLACAL
jgi:hypothetical protein